MSAVLRTALALALGLAALGAAGAALAAGSASGAAAEVTVEPGIAVSPGMPRGIRVVVQARPGESWAELARRLTGRFANAEALRGREPATRPDPARRYELPFELLTPVLQKEAVAVLLPLDRCDGAAWLHQPSPRFPADQSFEALAAWFASGSAGAASLEVALRGTHPGPGGRLRLPCVGIAPWLADARGCCTALTRADEEDRAEAAAVDQPGADLLRTPIPPPPVVPPAVVRPPVLSLPPLARAEPQPRKAPRSGAGGPRDLLEQSAPAAPRPPSSPVVVAAGAAARIELDYGRDEKGAFASYRLKPGDAVYSAVIVRLTGRVHARDVNQLVPVIAERSGVRSFASLPVGFQVKVPLELLAAEYLPASDPRRKDYERRREEVAQFRNRDRAAALQGVAVILDAGHGGRDRGAESEAVWESDYVYDILCRIKERLEKTTRARVLTLVRNQETGFRPRDRRRLEPLADTFVLTHPPYRLDDPVVGVNLRWYLANSLYRRLVREGYEPGRVVFTSIHADSLHPSVRGAMVYVPAEEHTAGRHGRRGPEYDRRHEVAEGQYFSFSDAERLEAEGRSRDLAASILEAFAARALPVHDEKPVRGSVLRDGREWLPAVLASNRVPARVLLEVCNLNHAEDNRLLEAPAFRDAVAEAYVAALLAYYGNGAGPVVAGKR